MKRLSLVALFAVVSAGAVFNQSQPASLQTQLEKLKAHTALILPSSAIDERPHWSPDGKYLAVNVMGKWHRIELPGVRLEEGKWHEMMIGVNSNRASLSDQEAGDLKKWDGKFRHHASKVQSSDGDIFEFDRKGLSTRFVVTPAKAKAMQIWASELENCGELALSPDEKWIAFLCETNGMFVASVEGLKKR